jgi:uncharacterized integral membrane protein
MNTKHLPDEVLQLYALDPSRCEPGASIHLKYCSACKVQLETYQFLLKKIAEEEVPAFDFNLAELVLASLPAPKPRRIAENAFTMVASFMIIIFVGLAIYQFRNYARLLFSYTRPMILYLTLTSVAGLMIFLCIDMFRQYQQKMKSLDYL